MRKKRAAEENEAMDSEGEHARSLSAAASPDGGGGESGDSGDNVVGDNEYIVPEGGFTNAMHSDPLALNSSRRIKGLGMGIHR